MMQTNDKTWSFNRQINLSVVVQLTLLALLIIGSYVNLQGRLDLLQHDVTMLLQCQKRFQQKLESLTETNISYEYRLQAIENSIARFDRNTISSINSDLKGQQK